MHKEPKPQRVRKTANKRRESYIIRVLKEDMELLGDVGRTLGVTRNWIAAKAIELLVDDLRLRAGYYLAKGGNEAEENAIQRAEYERDSFNEFLQSAMPEYVNIEENKNIRRHLAEAEATTEKPKPRKRTDKGNKP